MFFVTVGRVESGLPRLIAVAVCLWASVFASIGHCSILAWGNVATEECPCHEDGKGKVDAGVVCFSSRYPVRNRPNDGGTHCCQVHGRLAQPVSAVGRRLAWVGHQIGHDLWAPLRL